MMEGDKTTTTWTKNLVEHTPTRREEMGREKWKGKVEGEGGVSWRRFSSSISSLVVSESGILLPMSVYPLCPSVCLSACPSVHLSVSLSV